MRVHSNPTIKKETTDRSLKDMLVRGKMIVRKDKTIEAAKFCLVIVHTTVHMPVHIPTATILMHVPGIVDHKGICDYIRLQGYSADVVNVKGRMTIVVDHPIDHWKAL